MSVLSFVIPKLSIRNDLLIDAANEINTGTISTHILRLSSSIQQLLPENREKRFTWFME